MNILAVETKITAEAGFPELSEGQNVLINSKSVGNAVSASQHMSDTEMAAWQPYTYYVDL